MSQSGKLASIPRRFRSAVAYSLVAAITLAGGVFAWFRIVRPGVRVGITRSGLTVEGVVVGLLALIAGLLAIGALWGFGIALLNKRHPRRLAAAGAKHWGIPTLVFAALILEGVNAFQDDLSLALDVSRHFIFTISFAFSTLVITAVAVRGMVRALGRDELARRTGIYSGLASAVGFILVDLVMLSQGWELGRWMGGRSVMLTVMFAGNLGAALAGGATMGWLLGGLRVPNQADESERVQFAQGLADIEMPPNHSLERTGESAPKESEIDGHGV